MPRVVHFELAVDDSQRASRFYGEVFGWKAEKYPGPADYWLITTGEGEPGIDGAFQARSEQAEPWINTIGVTSVDEWSQKVRAAGGTAGEKMPIPGVGWFTYCTDTEGNRFGIYEDDPTAPMPDWAADGGAGDAA